MPHPILTLAVRAEQDVVLARQRTRELAERLGFELQDQTRIATAVSEIARNALAYGGGGRVHFRVELGGGPPLLEVLVSDEGPGIAALAEILDGRYRSPSGMGLGLLGARRLMDRFQVESAPGGGTRVLLGKLLPHGAAPLLPADLAGVAEALARSEPDSPFDEIHRQNRELLRALEEERRRHDDLLRLNQELEDTNRGVVALYAELDDRVEQLRRANTLRAQFTSYLSHEFRTPLDSIIALSGLLLSRVDGELTEEQEKQVGYVRRSARDLLSMVDDLLDTARMEAGQVQLRPHRFTVAELFSALRATLRPLLTSDAVRLAFDEAHHDLALHSDEAKVSQILRNFIANALKFTERGEIRVAVESLTPEGEVTFAVADTGVGIPEADQGWIFEDFTQVEGAVQRRVRGTGLGLALSRKLAEMLGGSVSVRSTPGVGSTFYLTLPRLDAAPEGEGSAAAPAAAPQR